jgi:hypothetical protein
VSDVLVVEFHPTDELAKTMEVVDCNMAAMGDRPREERD